MPQDIECQWGPEWNVHFSVLACRKIGWNGTRPSLSTFALQLSFVICYLEFVIGFLFSPIGNAKADEPEATHFGGGQAKEQCSPTSPRALIGRGKSNVEALH